MGTDGLTDPGMALAWVSFADVAPPDGYEACRGLRHGSTTGRPVGECG